MTDTSSRPKSKFEFTDKLPDSVRSSGGRPISPIIAEFRDALRATPGKWAKWPTEMKRSSAGSRAYQINHGSSVAFPASEFDAAVRQGVMYVRFIGGAQ